MENITQVRTLAKLALGIVALVMTSTSYIPQTKAENVELVNHHSRRLPNQETSTTLTKPQKRSGKVSFIQPKLPSSGAPSGRQRGAAGRGNCLKKVNIPLTALVPSIKTSTDNKQNAIVATNVWGLTVQEHPTFLFYVPYNQTTAKAEFVLQDAEDNDIYRAAVILPQEPGIVRLQLPPESAPLAVDKMYHWYFKIRCSQNMASPVFVEGWVQRVILNPTITNQIATATSLEQQAQLYAKNGIWYDTVALLAQMRQQNLENPMFKADWVSLLEAVDLSTLASESIKGLDHKDKKSLISEYNP